MRVPTVVLTLSIIWALVPAVKAQDSPDALPKVVQHSQPIYPALALQTRIQGNVRLKIVTDSESVREAPAETGHPLLRRAAATHHEHR